MGRVEQIYNAKLNQVQSVLDDAASRAGFSSVSFGKVLDAVQKNASLDSSVGIDAVSDANLAVYSMEGLKAGGSSKETAYDTIIAQAAAKYDLPPAIIKGVIRVESSFNKNAVSHCGAMGLMQLMPGTARELKVTDAFDPVQNIFGGAKYIRAQLDRFGDIRLALAAYNTGPGRIASLHIKDPDNASEYTKISRGVRGYVDKVLAFSAEYSA